MCCWLTPIFELPFLIIILYHLCDIGKTSTWTPLNQKLKSSLFSSLQSGATAPMYANIGFFFYINVYTLYGLIMHVWSFCFLCSQDVKCLADILKDFQNDHLDLSCSITVIARRKNILQSACVALSRSYFAWHKLPHIEFVGEMAEDYGGPRREYFRLIQNCMHPAQKVMGTVVPFQMCHYLKKL